MAAGDGVGRRLREWVPRWWRGEGGAVGRGLDLLLWPAEGLFRVGVAARNRAFDAGILRVEQGPIPVVSVGNIGIGGAGKTPFAAWVAGRLAGWGARPAVVVSGYGEDEVRVHREINPSAPVVVARRRVDGVREAAADGCDVAVLDDAFQHRWVRRDLDLVLVGVDGWRGRMRLLPRGGWREGAGALSRADFVVVTRKAAGEAAARELEKFVAARVSPERVVRCRIAPTGLIRISGVGAAAGDPLPLAALSGRRVLAVTSLADPAPFLTQLEASGAVAELAAYPDHHPFTAEDAVALAERALERPMVMTRKEAVKLRELLPPDVDGWLVGQEVVIESNGEALDAALRRLVGR